MSSKIIRSRGLIILLVILLLIGIFHIPPKANALELANRGLTMNTAIPGATAIHQFHFQYKSTSNVGSILFEYCESPVDGVLCVPPPGIDASGANLSLQTGETGFSILSATSNTIILTRPSVATGQTLSTYTFNGIINPNFNSCTNIVVPNCTFYGRIYTFASSDATGPYTDFGGLAASTNPTLSITSIVPPLLFFCVGLTITGTDCTTAQGDIVNLGTLTPVIVSSGTSQMVAATNGQFGLTIAADGTTMTSGNNFISALGAPTVSAPGNSQFGFNLVADTNPQSGQNPSGPGRIFPTANYDIPNEFLFNPGDIVASSVSTTDYSKLTVSYISNITPAQAPGLYTSTITYVCTASF